MEEKKRWTLRMRAADEDIFEDIIAGRKTVETRAASVRYKDIKPGDGLIFVCGKRSLSRTVKKLKVFPSLEAMAEEIPIKEVMPGAADLEAMRKVYAHFPGYKEKLEHFGILALWI